MRSVVPVLLIGAAPVAVTEAKESTTSFLSRYERASCLAFREEAGGARYWNATIALRNGSRVTVRGTGFTGGAVYVFYESSGQEYTAATPGDYVYPVEVRFDSRDDILYVAASGLAGGFWEQTWLFAFDLPAHRQIVKRRIRYQDLPIRFEGKTP